MKKALVTYPYSRNLTVTILAVALRATFSMTRTACDTTHNSNGKRTISNQESKINIAENCIRILAQETGFLLLTYAMLAESVKELRPISESASSATWCNAGLAWRSSPAVQVQVMIHDDFTSLKFKIIDLEFHTVK